jgi:hypothetical protein
MSDCAPGEGGLGNQGVPHDQRIVQESAAWCFDTFDDEIAFDQLVWPGE